MWWVFFYLKMQKSRVKRAIWATQGDAISYMGPHRKKKSKQDVPGLC